MTEYTIESWKVTELKELVEDVVELFCDDNMVSGELAWKLVETLGEAKLTYMKDM